MNATYFFYPQDLYVSDIFVGTIEDDGTVSIHSDAVEMGVVEGYSDDVIKAVLESVVENACDAADLKEGVGSQAFKNACDKYGVRNTEG